MDHIDEKTIELFALRSTKVEAERDAIQAHLDECPGCSDLYEEMVKFYNGAAKRQEERMIATSKALTLRTMITRVPPFDFRGVLDEIPKTLPARFVLFITRHPIVSSTSFVGLFLAALLAFLPKSEPSDSNPSFARAKNEYLTVYNRSGQELWKKHIGFGYDFEQTTFSDVTLKPEQALTVFNADGKGENEVIAIFGWHKEASETPLYNVVVCFDAEGHERWRYEFHRQMIFGGEAFTDNYRFLIMMVGDFDADGKQEVIAMVRHHPFWSSAVIRLDAVDGSLEGEYWHTGWIKTAKHFDVDGDGTEELFFAGENNALDAACLAILDPRRIVGHSPLNHEFVPDNLEAGTEKYYIIFPRTDLETLSNHPRNVAYELQVSGSGSFHVGCQESFPEGGYAVFYEFDSSFRVRKAILSDDFVAFHRQMEAEGRLHKKLDEEYTSDLLKAVRYWDGEKFVPEPTMNRKYRQIARK